MFWSCGTKGGGNESLVDKRAALQEELAESEAALLDSSVVKGSPEYEALLRHDDSLLEALYGDIERSKEMKKKEIQGIIEEIKLIDARLQGLIREGEHPQEKSRWSKGDKPQTLDEEEKEIITDASDALEDAVSILECF